MSAAWLLNGYSPGQYAATLHCPWLVCVAANDAIALPGPAIDAALSAPQGEPGGTPRLPAEPNRALSRRHSRITSAHG
ncbi:MAG: hypothetical protein AB7Q76_20810 [Gammaproteobacteria bacterium]